MLANKQAHTLLPLSEPQKRAQVGIPLDEKCIRDGTDGMEGLLLILISATR